MSDAPAMPHDHARPANEPPDGPAGLRFGRFRPGDRGRYHDLRLGRQVMLRCVPAAAAGGLQAEAGFLARLQHPALPCVYEFVQDDAEAALVLPPVSGLTLAAAVASRADGGQTFPAIADATACVLSFLAICEALQVAHLQGVAHGDITPDCILLADDGHLLLDGWTQASQRGQRRSPLPDADQRQDVRQLARCLFFAVAGEPAPMQDADRLAPLPSALARRVPGGLLSIIRRSLGTGGHPSVAALRTDLTAHLGGQRQDDEPVQVRDWPARLRRAVTLLLLIAVLAGGVLAFAWRPLGSYATWGTPIVAEDFTSAAWKQRWGSLGRWEQRRDGWMESQGPAAQALILKQRLTPPVAIEYTGAFTAEHAGDLSVWWCEDEPLAERPPFDVDGLHGWFVQAGAWNNSWCAIQQSPERLRCQVNDLVLKPDHAYRFRVEIHPDRLAMWIDDRPVLEHRPSFPIGVGSISLYTWGVGKRFDDVRIWQQAVPERVSPLIAGHLAFRAGRFSEAATAYGYVADSHPGRPLGSEALYYQGMALQRSGPRGKAGKAWDRLPDGELRRQAHLLTLDDMVADGDLDNAEASFLRWWQAWPGMRELLRQRWMLCGQRLRDAGQMDQQHTERWLRLRDATFPSDPSSRWLAAELLYLSGRWEELVVRFKEERRFVARALFALGRGAEVLASDWASPSERVAARINDGDLAGAFASPQLDDAKRAYLLCKSGRAAEAATLDPSAAALYLGDAEKLLDENAFGTATNQVLIALGRIEDAAGPGVPGLRFSGRDLGAMLLLGRYAEAERLGSTAMFPNRLFDHLLAGRNDEARAMRQQLRFHSHRHEAGHWFGAVIGAGLIDEALGTDGALRRAVQAGTAHRTGWGGRCAPICEAILDAAKEEALRSWAWRSETTAWLLVVQAVRAELSGDRPAAHAAWQAYKALPYQQRLLSGLGLSMELESYAAWRMAALASAAPP